MQYVGNQIAKSRWMANLFISLSSLNALASFDYKNSVIIKWIECGLVLNVSISLFIEYILSIHVGASRY